MCNIKILEVKKVNYVTISGFMNNVRIPKMLGCLATTKFNRVEGPVF